MFTYFTIMYTLQVDFPNPELTVYSFMGLSWRKWCAKYVAFFLLEAVYRLPTIKTCIFYNYIKIIKLNYFIRPIHRIYNIEVRRDFQKQGRSRCSQQPQIDNDIKKSTIYKGRNIHPKKYRESDNGQPKR